MAFRIRAMTPMMVAQVDGPSAFEYKLTVRPIKRYGTCRGIEIAELGFSRM
jgi:hypothetical protein